MHLAGKNYPEVLFYAVEKKLSLDDLMAVVDFEIEKSENLGGTLANLPQKTKEYNLQ